MNEQTAQYTAWFHDKGPCSTQFPASVTPDGSGYKAKFIIVGAHNGHDRLAMPSVQGANAEGFVYLPAETQKAAASNETDRALPTAQGAVKHVTIAERTAWYAAIAKSENHMDSNPFQKKYPIVEITFDHEAITASQPDKKHTRTGNKDAVAERLMLRTKSTSRHEKRESHTARYRMTFTNAQTLPAIRDAVESLATILGFQLRGHAPTPKVQIAESTVPLTPRITIMNRHWEWNPQCAGCKTPESINLWGAEPQHTLKAWLQCSGQSHRSKAMMRLLELAHSVHQTDMVDEHMRSMCAAMECIIALEAPPQASQQRKRQTLDTSATERLINQYAPDTLHPEDIQWYAKRIAQWRNSNFAHYEPPSTRDEITLREAESVVHQLMNLSMAVVENATEDILSIPSPIHGTQDKPPEWFAQARKQGSLR